MNVDGGDGVINWDGDSAMKKSGPSFTSTDC